jgi:hypothetical protein
LKLPAIFENIHLGIFFSKRIGWPNSGSIWNFIKREVEKNANYNSSDSEIRARFFIEFYVPWVETWAKTRGGPQHSHRSQKFCSD